MRLVFTFLVSAICANAATYWVSPDGAATWVNAQSETVLAGTNCTTLALANANVAAGDVVNFRGGTYNVSPTTYTGAISPVAAGGFTFQAYTGETPYLVNGNPHPGFVGGYVYGVKLTLKTNVVIKGFKFEDFDFWTSATGCWSCELSYCEFYMTDAYIANGGSSFGVFFQKDGTVQSTNNWIHHNILHNLTQPAPAESGDIIRIGSYTAGDDGSDYNTIEDNLLYGAGHTLTDSFSHRNVWRRNIGLNYGFKADPNLSGICVSAGSWTMTATNVNFATDFTGAGGPSVVGFYIHDLDDTNSWGAKIGLITALSTNSTPNDTITFTNVWGAGTYPAFSAGHRYVVGSMYLSDTNSPSLGNFAHRAFGTDSLYRLGQDFNLFEGNRLGYASPNPNNNGAENLTFSSGSCIVRFNAMFGASGLGMYFKNGLASANNRVYNNTFFGNGRFTGTQHPVAPIVKAGVYVASADSTNNAIKNCIVWGNYAPIVVNAGTITTSSNLAAVADSYCSVAGDPLFSNTNMTSLTNTNLPDLTLTASSAAIDQGGPLTYANGAGAATNRLVVDDALYFQDGTWGSTLASLDADTIAIGTVGNAVLISSIDYTNNIITLAANATWSDRASVWLVKDSAGQTVLQGAAPDLGAYEYTPPSPDPGAHFDNIYIGNLIIGGP